ncbi:4-hydroxybenzoyl-CoA thioesterase [Caenispirillum salinarum AK4]|uniref:4-hydroxybenzoyl-CoA thioesterase n=1 Tax=Caenispirillum salinarum AK4 TaxID=1238182 RepID=K9H6N8_9PROT|nr:thioesterase family protein [Caenispirillum salinarum]EKV32704.1 4-hydroxybenzoyl-CoA thioesterase [Caenispirillum salinarum AK4]
MAREDYRFCHPFRVRYSEVDRQNVAYNSHYLTWFDVAIWEYVKALPFDLSAYVESSGNDLHTVKALVEFRKSAEFDQDIEACVRVGRIGRSSLTFTCELHAAGADELLATGEVVWVNTDQTAHKSTALPEDLIARIRAFEKTAPEG